MKKLSLTLNAVDPHAWIEKHVHKVLNGGDKAKLMNTPEDQLLHIVQQADRGHGSLKFAPHQKLRQYIKTWKATVK